MTEGQVIPKEERRCLKCGKVKRITERDKDAVVLECCGVRKTVYFKRRK